MSNGMIICAAFVPILYFISLFLVSSQKNFLIIGILSAQENFDLRNITRLTWLRDLGSYPTKHFFLVGKHFCQVPPEDRFDEYSCKTTSITLPPGAHENFTFYSGNFTCSKTFSRSEMYHGFSFVTNHDIILESFGIPNWKIKNQHVKIKLLNAASGTEVVSANFISTDPHIDVLWKPTAPYLLPKGFEGIIVLEANGSEGNWKCGFNWTDSNILTFVHLIQSETEKPISFSIHSQSPAVVGFKLKGINELRRFIALKPVRKKSWSERIEDASQKLRKEISQYDDILLLDMVDVYRNIPKKMLLFFKWAHQNMDFSYLLKADDDTLINIPLVTKELQMALKKNTQISKLWWWSTFRKNWAVQSHGKWREDVYQSITYPPFPCGAGYVLNYNAVKFLGLNADVLSTSYQGEDVSLGIWLAGVNPAANPNRTPFCMWVCNKEENHEEIEACNYPQLSSADMWNKYRNIM